MFEEYLNEKNTVIPEEVIKITSKPSDITVVDFEDKNAFLKRGKQQKDIGYTLMNNGDYLVSVYCEMPGVTAEMINWWFWWHAKESVRYKLWYPGEHISIGYSKKNKAYFNAEKQPPFEQNTHYPVEKIGKMMLPLVIHFVSPEKFGFDKRVMLENDVATVVCGHVGVLKGLFYHTQMAHIFFYTDNGLLLVSRFWIGKSLKNPLLRKLILNDGIAKDMVRHCYVEYRNLANKLPSLYAKFGKDDI